MLRRRDARPVALRLAPSDEPPLDQVLVLPDRLAGEVPRVGVVDEFRDRLSYGRDLRLDDADFAGRLPAANEIVGGLPGAQIEAPAHVLAAQRTLDPDRAFYWAEKMAERVGFEPTCRLPDKTLS